MEEKAKSPLIEKISKMGKWFWAFVAAAVLLVGAIVAIIIVAVGSKEEPPVIPNEGPETGVYYYDAQLGEYTLSLNSGNKFAISGPDLNKSGEYTVDGTTITFDFVKDEDGTTTATTEGDALAFVWKGATMNFIKKVNYTFTFNTNGGSAIDAVSVVNGKTVANPADPTRDGYVFLGWYADEGLKTPFNFVSTIIKTNTTVYAKWAAKVAGQEEYNVSFNLGYEAAAPAGITTVGGKLHFSADYVEPTREGYTFAGWFVSMYEDGAKLTSAATEGTAFNADTTLYAVWTNNADAVKSPIVSVSGNTISWNSVAGANAYAVAIYDAEGTKIHETSVGTTTYTFDFGSNEAGDYSISVIAKGSTDSAPTVRYYKNKALDRVYKFEVINNTLVFNAVANAEKYLITVDCGNSAHNHTNYNNGNSTVYNFQNCSMQVGGIKFTVTAVADGYASSTSTTFVYEKNLDKVGEIVYNAENVAFSWVPVSGATKYYVSITSGENTVVVDNGNATTFAIKNYSGEVTIAVTPATEGYNSPEAATATVNKVTPATPTDIVINGMTVSWNDVGVENYIVRINGTSYPVSGATEYNLNDSGIAFTMGAKYSITVQAVGATDVSFESDAINAAYLTMGAVSYSQNVVSWDPVLGATRYEISVNGESTIVDGVNSARIALNQSGDNVIGVRVYTLGTNADFTTTTVYAYTVVYDTRSIVGGLYVEYVAPGDTLALPSNAELAGFTFKAWTTAVNNGSEHSGIFSGNNDITLYAQWDPKSYEITLSGVTENMSGAVNEQTVTVVYTKNFKLPVLTTTDTINSNFAGWFTAAGQQITDYLGNSIAPYGYTTDMMLVPHFTSGLVFELQSDSTYAVKKGVDINTIPVITIPKTYNDLPVTTILENGFYNCDRLVEINIPDTIRLIGTGAFNSCDALAAINVYDADPQDNVEVLYSSYDGALLFTDIEGSGITYLELFPRAKKGTYTIPAGVDAIRSRAFNYSKITSLTIPNDISMIGDYAFSNCRSLQQIIFEEGGTTPISVSTTAFYGCYAASYIKLPALIKGEDEDEAFSTVTLDYLTALETIEVEQVAGAYFSAVEGMLCSALGDTIIYCPKAYTGISGVLTIPNGINAIGASTFANRNAFTEIVIPSFVTEIGTNAFYGCRNVTKITFKGNRSRDLAIGNSAFYGCSNTREVTFEGNTTLDTGKVTVGTSAFSGINELRTITVADGANVAEFGTRAFAGNLKLRNINVSNNAVLAVIGASAFEGCEGLIKLTIPASTTNIGDKAFADCAFISTVAFAPNGQEISFGSYVFQNCVALTSVELPATVKEFNGSAFDGCDSLRTIVVDPANNYLTTEDGILYNKAKTEIMFYPKGINDPDLSELPWDTLTVIGASVFKNNPNVTSVTIPATITSIGANAFDGCVNLTSVNIAKNGTALTVGAYAFANCQQLTAIELPSYTASLGDGIFYGTPLASFTIPENVSYIGKFAFAYSNVTSINIPAKVAYIGDGAFLSSKLSSITFEEGTEPLTIGNIGEIDIDYRFEMFDYNNYTASKLFPNDYLEIDAYGVFTGTSLSTITLPARLTEIGIFAFYKTTSLETVNFAENSNLVTICDGAFYGSTVNAIQLQNTKVEDIGEFAFTESRLTSVTFPGTVTSIGKYAFADIGAVSSKKLTPSLASVTFVNTNNTNALTIGNYAFQNSAFTTITLPSRLISGGDKILVGADDPQYGVNIKNFYTFVYGNVKLAEIIVEEGNAKFGSKDGVFYEKDENGNLGTLIFCPPMKTGELIVPKTVTHVEHKAFYLSSLTTVEFEEFAEDDPNYKTPLLTIGTANSAQSALSSYAVFGGRMANNTGVRLTSSILYSYHSAVKDNVYSKNYITESAIEEIKFPSHIKLVSSWSVNGINRANKDHVLTGNPLSISFNPNSDLVEFYQSAFYSNDALTSLDLPKVKSLSTTDWNASTFAYNYNLEHVTFAEGSTLEMIPMATFSNAKKITEIKIPASVLYIADDAFYNCSALSSITFEDGSQIASIGSEAFANTAFTSFVFPDTVVAYGEKIFTGCTQLTKVTIGKGMTNVASLNANGNTSAVFIGCSSISEYDVPLGHPTMIDEDGVLYDIAKTAVLAYPPAKDSTDYTIPATVKEIGPYAFVAFSGTSIELPAELISIGYGAFYSSKLTSVSIPATVTNIGAYAFGQSHSSYACLETLTFAENSQLTTIGRSAFSYAAITELSLPDNVSNIGDSCFYDANKLQSATLSAALLAIPTSAFGFCEALESIEIQEKVATIGNQTFSNCKALKSLELPASLTTIGNQAFSSCAKIETIEFVGDSRLTTVGYQVFNGNKALKSITLPAGTSSIGLRAFDGCTALEYVDMSKTQFTTLESSLSSNKWYGFFNGCTNLKTVLLPETMEVIDSNCFKGCSKLESIYIPASVVTIRDGAFDGCSGLAEVSFAPGSAITELGSNPTAESAIFRGTTALKSIELPDTISTIGGNIFENSGLESITLPASLSVISASAFKGCQNLVEIDIPSTVTDVHDAAFQNCSNLTTLTLNEGLEYIGADAFGNCANIKSIFIPSTVLRVGGNPFSNCTGLESFDLHPENEGLKKIDGVLYDANVRTIILYPASETAAKYEMPSTVFEFASSAFAGAKIQEMIISDNIKVIPAGTFIDNKLLKSVTLPLSITRIEDYAFQGCETLDNIVIPTSVTYIGNYAFEGCTSLKNFDFGTRNTELVLGEGLFKGCTSYEDIVISSSISKLPNYMYAGTAIVDLVIPDNITDISSVGVFEGCEKLETVTFPEDLEGSIGERMFCGCTSLREITIPDGIWSIGEDWGNSEVFKDCTSLEKVTFGEGIACINDSTFDGCTNLEVIDTQGAPSLEFVGYYAFANCSSLKTLDLSGGPYGFVEIYDYAFYNCSSLTEINLPIGYLDWFYDGAFEGCSSLMELHIPTLGYMDSPAPFRGWTSEQSIYFDDEQWTYEYFIENPFFEWGIFEECEAKIYDCNGNQIIYEEYEMLQVVDPEGNVLWSSDAE